MNGGMSTLLVKQTNCGVLDGFAPLPNETCQDMVFGLAKFELGKLVGL